jgi:prephenate dehydrogenase
MKSAGIIGFGRFGQLTAKHLSKHFDVRVFSRTNREAEADRLGVKFASLEDCAGSDIVILSVPIKDLEGVLENAVPHLKAGALVLDVCSVKEEPVRLMEQLVPDHCRCISTHPLFGPDSATNGLKGKKIVLCPVSDTDISKVKEFLESLELDVIVTTPEEHDRQMAVSLALNHLLGRALIRMDIDRVELSTMIHDNLMAIVDIVGNDTVELFQDMQMRNRFAGEIRKKLIEELKRIDSELEEA